MKTPLFVIEGLDISAYKSVEELENHLEAIDVKKDAYLAYDAEGRLLTLGVVSKKIKILFGLFKLNLERVVVQSIEEEPKHEADLMKVLVSNLSATTAEDYIQHKSLQQLIQKFIDINGLI